MPQFDFYSFSTQIFWVLLGFILLYFFLLRLYVVNFSRYNKYYQKLSSKILS
jgi:hypothetical protein